MIKKLTINDETDDEMQDLSLKPLQNFVQRELILSEETKSVLQSDCDEARFALKSWPQETHKEMNKSFCTCNEGESDCHQQIIEIDRAIFQKQELKEKLKTNLLRERSRSRKPSIRDIYMPNSKSLTRLKRSSSVSRTRLENKQESRCEKSEKNSNENNQRGTSTKQRSSSSNHLIEIRSKSTSTDTKKKLPQLSQNNSKIKLKTGSQTNFVLANKQNFIKKTKSSENKNHLPHLIKAESTLSKDFMKMEIQHPEEIIDEKSHQNENCPFHGNNTSTKVVDRVVRSVDAVEGLDRSGVPSCLIKVLKVYHLYLKGKLTDTQTRDKKNEEASNNFLVEFNKMCDERPNRNSAPEKCPTLIKGFIEILGQLHEKDLNRIQKQDLKSKYSTLDSEFKNMSLDKRETRKSKVSGPPQDLLLNKRGWMSNGIWNDLCIPYFQGMTKTLCVRYSSRAQLFSLFDAIQQLQRAKYQEVLVHYLLHKVIPDVKKSLEPNTKEFSEAYKMCFTIIQILNPKVPVIVRTD